MSAIKLIIVFVCLVALDYPSESYSQEEPMKISSPDFGNATILPSHYALGGDNISPALQWGEAPPETKSFALIVDDPDAPRGTWVHWVVYDIALSTTELPQNSGAGSGLPPGAKQGLNSWGKPIYQGPQPPPGQNHRYYFRLYALDTPSSGLPAGARASQVREHISKHVLAESSLMAYFPSKR